MASTDIAFSPSVKAVQERRGSRAAYARLEQNWRLDTKIDAVLAKFIAGMRSFYFATASKDGQPYVQHRGGPPGFLRVVDETTLAFADFAGNRQYSPPAIWPRTRVPCTSSWTTSIAGG
jgi:uncharacterized protein